MAARFQVLLTQVRHVGAGRMFRDERTCPELVLDAYTAETAQQAEALFRALCALGSVRSGQQRAKVIALSGSDTDRAGAWVAPPVDVVPRWLDLAGAR
ncbi:hypothetical protein [Allorhizocola rhizosphaerae]|uniref:hypothetical protein n=1 Tax=Allorhizocola rhizosphaerae TaxID=1872709 RepID=UPI000E3E6C94|nr:hypothetical protein [Allorhizocola rhizosphaerae]